ncbi:MAG: Rieske 2Fe-2S domain-containing protein [Chloroflexia bacterium]|nr:Rieske 2Fe-2S domain-containing protein [Chloroflexia bacterium]
MQVTFLGHAGMFIETRQGTILCDPFFNPAYFASWFPFPANDQLNVEPFVNPDFLYLSHTHLDHFDTAFLRDRVAKNTKVLLPDHPLGLVERKLRDIGFTDFIPTKNARPTEVDGLRIMITALNSPADGPLGDSGLCVDDGEVRLFNQNDSRPVEFEALHDFGPFDVHFLQYSGAIWYPMVYRFPQKMKDALSSKKRRTQMERALRYAEQIGAPHIVPSAGPPCFLDDDLLYLNDLDRDPTNIFPDATVFLEMVAEAGFTSGHLMIPGSVGTIGKGTMHVAHPMPDADVAAIYTDKRAHIDAYKARQKDVIRAEKASWPRGEVDILPAIKGWFEPLLAQADQTCLGIDDRLLLDCGDAAKVVINFRDRVVHAWAGEPCRYTFSLDPALVEYCLVHHEEDWVNNIFLSCRFAAERKGQYNEFLYSFFKCLSPERIQYAEGYYAEQAPEQQLWECDGYLIQRRCPHLKADLTRFGEVEDGVLTCTLHGWQFEIATGRCLTSDDRHLFSKKIDEPSTDQPAESTISADD